MSEKVEKKNIPVIIYKGKKIDIHRCVYNRDSLMQQGMNFEATSLEEKGDEPTEDFPAPDK
jgi:hypothetical protein